MEARTKRLFRCSSSETIESIHKSPTGGENHKSDNSRSRGSIIWLKSGNTENSEIASSKYKYMRQVLIATQIIGLSTAALLIGISDINSVADARIKSSATELTSPIPINRAAVLNPII